MLPAPRPAVRFATSDKMLLSLQDLGQGSVTHLRETLGRDGLRPLGKKPA